MPAAPLRLVLDTNVLLRGLINNRSASGRIVVSCDRRNAIILLSRPALAEYRAVLFDAKITTRYPELTNAKVETALRRLRYVGDVLIPVNETFEYRRDPRDAKWIELAIAGRATHIVSVDNDLLALSSGYDESAKRFRQRLPAVRVLAPDRFLAEYAREFRL